LPLRDISPELITRGRRAPRNQEEDDAVRIRAPYLDWPPYVTARATALGVDATPTVLVAGAVVTPEARPIGATVAAAGER
jgi:hypothetical protein